MDLKGKTTIFVYGTLMKGFPNERVIADFPHTNYKATVENMELYNVGMFPAMVKGENTYEGELVVFDGSVPADVIYRNMDRLEGYDVNDPRNSLYVRESVMVNVNGESVKTSVYLWNQSCDRLIYIDPKVYSGYREYTQKVLKARFSA